MDKSPGNRIRICRLPRHLEAHSLRMIPGGENEEMLGLLDIPESLFFMSIAFLVPAFAPAGAPGPDIWDSHLFSSHNEPTCLVISPSFYSKCEHPIV